VIPNDSDVLTIAVVPGLDQPEALESPEFHLYGMHLYPRESLDLAKIELPIRIA